MGNKVKISRGHRKMLPVFLLGQHFATIRRLRHPQCRQAGIALRGTGSLAPSSFAQRFRYVGIAKSALWKAHSMHFLTWGGCPPVGRPWRPALPVFGIYIVYRNPSMLLLYKKEQKPHAYWAGEVLDGGVCMANTIIP